MVEDQIFYVGQKALIEKDGKFLIMHDSQLGSDLPGGKIQIGEIDLHTALKREVMEETSLEISVHEPFYTSIFVMPPVSEGGQEAFVGKKFYCVVYKATYLSGEVILSKEHDRFDWVDHQTYQSIVKSKGGLAENALEKYFLKQI